MKLPIRNPLIIALDVDSRERVLDLCEQLKAEAGCFKLGPRLILKYGESIISEVAGFAPVFVDMKHFDIPSTLISAARASFHAGASLITVHALSGLTALQQLADLEKELNQIRPFQILAVTILTSWDQNEVPANFQQYPIAQHVRSLAESVQQSGLHGLVCSSHEIELLSELSLNLVTPGIRFPEDSSQDQKRIMGPREAIQLGSSALVVGRPILEAQNPQSMAKKYLEYIQS